eukprot:gene10143-2487_t
MPRSYMKNVAGVGKKRKLGGGSKANSYKNNNDATCITTRTCSSSEECKHLPGRTSSIRSRRSKRAISRVKLHEAVADTFAAADTLALKDAAADGVKHHASNGGRVTLTTAVFNAEQKFASLADAPHPECAGGHNNSPALAKQALDRAAARLALAKATLIAFDKAELTSSRATNSPKRCLSKRPTKKNNRRVKAAERGQAGPTVALGLHAFQVVDVPDWAKITKWKALTTAREQYDPAAQDHITGEPLGETSPSDKDPVVELVCSTPRLRCIFRKSIISRCLQSQPVCVNCGYRFSSAPGPQPSGTALVGLQHDLHCATFPSTGTITIRYNFGSGRQGPRMQRPTLSYCGTNRTVFIPNTTQGRLACHLLVKAFNAGVSFVVSDSVTTGAQNQECAAVGVFSDAHELEIAAGWKRLWTKEKKKRQVLPLAVALAAVSTTPNTSTGATGTSSSSKPEAFDSSSAATVTSTTTDDTHLVTSDADGRAEVAKSSDAKMVNFAMQIRGAMKARNVNLVKKLMAERTAAATAAAAATVTPAAV